MRLLPRTDRLAPVRERGVVVRPFPASRRLVTAAVRAGRRIMPMHGLLDVDVTTARGLGAGARRVTALDELVPAMREALADGRPFLLDVDTDREARAPVTNFDHIEERAI